MSEGEKSHNSKDHIDRALVVSNNILSVVSIILTVIDILKTVLFR